ncbi:Lectin-receptor kinase [Quillaja saponaria]|uniref:Lectin-receptor kinase n=1 Tax=Quillaja saponaria TaxID=32244 RepID=A0AAD7M1D8_QUISA|nr:Lectin-receptor kinase [Quillaja saponaria]
MPMEALGLFSLVLFFVLRFASSDINFAHNGFLQANLSLDGASCVRSDGILAVTNGSSKIFGHAFHPSPLQFTEKSHKNNFSIATLSTNFVFSIIPKYPDIGVEFDIAQNLELEDINDNHVGIDVSSLISNVSEPAAYFFSSKSSKNSNNSINLKSGDPIQAWVDYHSKEKLLNVSISPLGMPRPYRPLISFPVDLSLVLDDYMYAGFSASTGLLTAEHNVHGWSFRIGGRAEDLDQTRLPFIGSSSSTEVQYKKSFAVGITLASITLVIFVTSAVVHVLRRIRNDDEVLKDWEVEYGTRRFKYSELHRTTRGFGARNLIGSGGFGKVYRGVISSTGLEVAIKRVAHDSRQGMKEFVAEITSMGRLRHRNLVQLHGWCRKQDELLLIYEYVPNGSLDKLLTEDDSQKKKLLTWGRRYRILTGVAQALLYLHEECDQQVVHRDVKPSNVLIDADLNPKLGDFGLARIYEHGINTQTTHIVGTLGYMAPEVTRTGKATTSTDVYGYGNYILERTSPQP